MSKQTTAWVGTGLHLLIAALMVFSGALKLVSPDTMVAEVVAPGIKQHLSVIGIGEIISGLLLLPAELLPIGMLLTSSFWGGAILAHMQKPEPYVAQSVLLVLTWLGGALRRPDLLPFGADKPLPTEPFPGPPRE